jgi:hypothetical protein
MRARKTACLIKNNRDIKRDVLGKAVVGGRARHLPCPLAPALCSRSSWDSKGCCSIPSASGGRGEALIFPADGDNRICRPRFALARATKHEASYVRMKCRFRTFYFTELGVNSQDKSAGWMACYWLIFIRLERACWLILGPFDGSVERLEVPTKGDPNRGMFSKKSESRPPGQERVRH